MENASSFIWNISQFVPKINIILSKNNKFLFNINLFIDFQVQPTYNIRQQEYKTTIANVKSTIRTN